MGDPCAGRRPRAFCDRMNGWAIGEGQPGLGYIIFEMIEGPEADSVKDSIVKAIDELVAKGRLNKEWARQSQIEKERLSIVGKGPIAKNVGEGFTEVIRSQFKLHHGDACFFVAGNPEKFYKFAGEARSKIGRELNLIDEDRFEFCWIVDFPMYEWNEEEKKIDFSHNPFSMPQGGLAALEAAKSNDDLLKIKAFQYDIVCNGVELSSGAIRNHLPEVMVKAFAIAGYGRDVLEAKFGGMLKALTYGAPPHGGIAPGIDRIVMLLAGATNLRDVIMFPMNQQAMDLLMGAPSEVTPKQLRELHIRLAVPDKKP